MKNIVINSAFLFLLVIFPTIPGYLHLYNQSSNPKTKLCIKNGATERINILKGDLAYLEAIFSRALENKSDNNDMPNSQETNNTINLFVYSSSLKIDYFIPQLLIDKLLYSKNNDLSSVYLKVPSPPPKHIS
ncbi:MAG: hypothetical protein ABFR05_12875 [Bacteroidota bacterium]